MPYAQQRGAERTRDEGRRGLFLKVGDLVVKASRVLVGLGSLGLGLLGVLGTGVAFVLESTALAYVGLPPSFLLLLALAAIVMVMGVR